MFMSASARQRGQARAAATKARRKGCKPHPSNTIDERYTPEQFAFLKAWDAHRRRTMKAVPDESGLVEVMRGLGYEGDAPDPERFEAEVQRWRESQDRRFPPATTLFGILTTSFGFTEGGRPS